MNRLSWILILLTLWIPVLQGCSTSGELISRTPTVPM